MNIFDSIKQQPIVNKLVNATQNIKPKLLQKLVNYLNETSYKEQNLKRKRDVSDSLITNNDTDSRNDSIIEFDKDSNETIVSTTKIRVSHKANFLHKNEESSKTTEPAEETDNYQVENNLNSTVSNVTENIEVSTNEVATTLISTTSESVETTSEEVKQEIDAESTTISSTTEVTTNYTSTIATTTTTTTTTEYTTTTEKTTIELTTAISKSTTTPESTTSTLVSTEPSTITTTTTVSENTTVETTSPIIKFKVVNYTLINYDNLNTTLNSTSNGSKSYSLRLHIKGYKWKEKFNNVNSSEAQDFLKQKILPLLYKNLNLNKDELNDIKLLRLFKEKRNHNH
jgi:hypothetical protein